jgi:hypothetical protein
MVTTTPQPRSIITMTPLLIMTARRGSHPRGSLRQVTVDWTYAICVSEVSVV